MIVRYALAWRDSAVRWCRDWPTQVTDMLDRLYHDLDVLADALGVYKIETIGDGVATPNPLTSFFPRPPRPPRP